MNENLINDVASPIDLRLYEDALEWQEQANVKRLWRKDFFDYYVSLINKKIDQCDVLELGSGPGFLAQHLLSKLPNIEYTAFDFSEAMHQLAQDKLNASERARAKYIVGSFKEADWQMALAQKYDFIIIHQALHELRHKNYANQFHQQVKTLLKRDALYLVCDHIFASDAMSNNDLYMSKHEHFQSLKYAGFTDIELVKEIKGLCLFECYL